MSRGTWQYSYHGTSLDAAVNGVLSRLRGRQVSSQCLALHTRTLSLTLSFFSYRTSYLSQTPRFVHLFYRPGASENALNQELDCRRAEYTTSTSSAMTDADVATKAPESDAQEDVPMTAETTTAAEEPAQPKMSEHCVTDRPLRALHSPLGLAPAATSPDPNEVLTGDSASGEGPTGELRKLNDIDVSRNHDTPVPSLLTLHTKIQSSSRSMSPNPVNTPTHPPGCCCS